MTDELRKLAEAATLPVIGEKYLLNPVLLSTPEGDDYTDDAGAKWAWFAHGYDTGMEPFYSAGQLKEAMESAWTASRAVALEEAATCAELYDLGTVEGHAIAGVIRAGLEVEGGMK